ncbi:ABC transporter ATP-binding protein [Acrocarpospora catenulata]|uniref:ABC transporter ATP-binding protein n=1 Tax=Acrocarpospora catenulata TaxID=2836182 RepID=UPI001BDAB8F7|nr:ABC transporter ATP-binding protein [Acrocarpospora catenulata]
MTTSNTPLGSAGEPVLSVRGLSVDFLVNGEWSTVVHDLSYEVRPHEVLAIVGESGSGKTQSSMALIGLLPPSGRATGSVKLDGTEILGLPGKRMSGIRGRQVGVVFQEPMTAMNPVYTIGFQICEVLRFHLGMSKRQARARAIELLRLVDLPDPELTVRKYPHQLSGGQLQRAVIAQAIACEPRLLIADEPTTALDVTVQAGILDLLRSLKDRIASSIILISHDLGVVADIADRVLVMKAGRVVESESSEQIFYRPAQPYTKELIAAVPTLTATAVSETPPAEVAEEAAPTDALVSARRLAIDYGTDRGPRFRAVDGVDFHIGRGEVLGLVGESGSGKSTIGQAAVGLVPVADGSLVIDGVELAGIRSADLKALRRRVSIVFQDPGSSLDPRMQIADSIAEPLVLHRLAKGKELAKRVNDLLDQVHLPRTMLARFPHELSGGQRQRVGIARAIALEPVLLVADEPTSALDVSVQAKVLEVFEELQRQHGFACLFISHDLAVVERLANRIAVMRRGSLVEAGPTRHLLDHPRHQYTRELLAAVPVADPHEQRTRRETRRLLSARGTPS